MKLSVAQFAVGKNCLPQQNIYSLMQLMCLCTGITIVVALTCNEKKWKNWLECFILNLKNVDKRDDKAKHVKTSVFQLIFFSSFSHCISSTKNLCTALIIAIIFTIKSRKLNAKKCLKCSIHTVTTSRSIAIDCHTFSDQMRSNEMIKSRQESKWKKKKKIVQTIVLTEVDK